MSETAFREVTKEEFKEIYFRLGGGKYSGWTPGYWQKFFEDEIKPDWRFVVQDPATPQHDQMWIVSDNGAKEYRLFFMTEDSTESVFDHPGKE